MKNEWLKKIEAKTSHKKCVKGFMATGIMELCSRMRVAIWANVACGGHRLDLNDLPFEEVMKIHFVKEAVVSGFSIWLDDREVFRQRFPMDFTVQVGETLNLDMRTIEMEAVSLVLS